MSDEEKFEAWKTRAEAIVELGEGQEEICDDADDGDVSKKWEDWIVDSDDSLLESWSRGDEGSDDRSELDELIVPERGLVKMAKFLAVSTLIPWALDILAHDYVLMPFLDRLPLASQTLDVRRSQKLEMVKELNREKARYRLEVEIGKSPLLSDDDLWWELRGKALELREEWRLENRKAFANIWSGMVFGISLFALLYANQGTILNLDRETLLEIIMEHYGLEVEKYTITIFICLVPVVMDACVKLWLFKFLPRLSPRVSNIFQEMKRH
uniref:Uncharacterized protein n=1 Tax=Brassica oleracea TaxID=3712 RepID=A0A3P6F5L5_BRAOL|nr:unnamed protein product [Brassica oleracea]